MSEISMYEAYKKKLQGLCDEHDLVYKINRNRYPISLTIRPCSGMDAQMSILENAEDSGYISPDAYMTFVYRDGVISYRTSEQFAISDALFSKLKNLFKNLHYCWLQYFFRDVMERGLLAQSAMPVIDESEADDIPDGAEPLEEYEDTEITEVEPVATDAEKFEILVETATKIVRAENKATVALLQRRMGVGYAEAARIMDGLEAAGVVGPFTGSEPREVFPTDLPDDEIKEENENE